MGMLGRLFGLRSRVLTPQEGYALWADTYPPCPHNPLMEVEEQAVAPMLTTLAPVRALDVGTGTGRSARLVAATGARTVVGVDLSRAMLMRNADGRPRVCGDARRLPFADRTFDLVCSSLMAGDIEHLSAWIDEAARVLAPGGHLVYSDFHPASTAKGWRRTFRGSNGELHELAFYRHTIEQHLHLLEQAALVVRTVREPRLEPHAPPLIAVFHAVKRC
jgi:ubiquinone/menaquinone biosynthesis C-methylase UbiE